MSKTVTQKLHFWGRLLLTATGLTTVVLPFVFCLVDSTPSRAESQANDAARPSFEVASVKLDKSRAPLPGVHLFGDRFNATTTVYELITLAYGQATSPLSDDQISGGTDWIKSELFDIDAKVEDSAGDGEGRLPFGIDTTVEDSIIESEKALPFDQRWGQAMLMVQSLLADRFKLKIRHETRLLPVYALLLAKNGPKFVEDNSHPGVAAILALGPGKLKATSSRLSAFVSCLAGALGGRVVLDKTGLRGNYSFTFQWAPESLAARGGQSAYASSSDSSGPSLFAALPEQLGLKLESTKAPVDVLVIDHIEKPSEN